MNRVCCNCSNRHSCPCFPKFVNHGLQTKHTRLTFSFRLCRCFSFQGLKVEGQASSPPRVPARRARRPWHISLTIPSAQLARCASWSPRSRRLRDRPAVPYAVSGPSHQHSQPRRYQHSQFLSPDSIGALVYAPARQKTARSPPLPAHADPGPTRARPARQKQEKHTIILR